MAFQNTESGVIPQINMTPMIDLLLVMLIIFLVVAPVHPKGLTAVLPQAAVSTPRAQREADVVLEVASDGSLRLNTRAVKREELAAAIVGVFRTRDNRTLFLRGAGDLLFGQMAGVIDVATGAGVERVALITGN